MKTIKNLIQKLFLKLYPLKSVKDKKDIEKFKKILNDVHKEFITKYNKTHE